MNKLLRLLIYLASFGLARGALFISPILLSNLLPAPTYGAIEWSHAAGSFSASILSFGTAAALPLVRLKQTHEGSLSGILMHHLLIIICCVIASFVFFFVFNSTEFSIAALIAPVVSLQNLWSVTLKTQGRGEASLALDAGLFALLAIAAIILYATHVTKTHLWLMFTILVYLFGLSFFTLFHFLERRRSGERLAYVAILKLGWPLMISALVTIAVTTSGRLVIGILGGPLLTADYSTLARVAALPIVAHQVILVAKFRDIYTLADKDVEKIVSVVLGTIVAAIILFWLLNAKFNWMLGPAFAKGFSASALAATLILIQSVLWSAISLNDLICTRKQKILQVLPWSTLSLLTAVTIGIFVVRAYGISLIHFVLAHCVIMIVFYFGQVMGMYIAGIRLWRAWLLTLVSFVMLSLSACLIYR